MVVIDIDTPQSPGWMLRRLSKKLADRQERLAELFDRYEGKPPKSAKVFQEGQPYRKFWEKSRLNLAEMIVRAIRHRMTISAIRTAANGDEYGDEDAWRIFRTCGLEIVAGDVHRTMLVSGDAYVIVGMHDGDLAITAEDPRQVVSMHDPVQQSKITCAAKFFHDADAERNYAYLYTPDRVYVAFQERKTPGLINFSASWDWDLDRGGVGGEPHGLGRCPVVRFRNEEGAGEFERHVNLLDRIDHMILQGMVTVTLQAFKQRAVMVDDLDDEDEHGNPVDLDEVFTSAPDKMWLLPKTAELWESGAVDLTPIWSGTDKAVQQLAAVSFTPLSMFSPEGQNQSAEGASLAREGLTTKATDRVQRAGRAWAEVMSLAFLTLGDEGRAPVEQITVDWLPVEKYGLSEKHDAAVKAKASGVPWRTIMEKVLQFTPEEVHRMEKQRADDLVLAPVDDATPVEDQ